MVEFIRLVDVSELVACYEFVVESVLDKLFLANVDNDSFITVRWLHSAMRLAGQVCQASSRDSVAPKVGAQWQNNECGLCGRIDIGTHFFVNMRGYHASMLYLSCQDFDLVKRIGLVGRSDHLDYAWNGFAVSSREAEHRRLFGRAWQSPPPRVCRRPGCHDGFFLHTKSEWVPSRLCKITIGGS